MSKRKSQSNRSRKKTAREGKTKKHSRVLPTVLGLCTVLGFAISLVVFLPRPTVLPPSVPVNKADQFSVSFDITNSGYIPLSDCTAMLGVGQITGKDAALDPAFIPTFGSRLVMPAWQHHRLAMDERFTIVLSDAVTPVESADVAIIVSYKPWFFPIRREKIFRFVTFRQTDGHQYWRSWPIGEPLPILQQRDNKHS